MTEGGTGTASPSGALCTIGETGVIVAGPGAVAVALKVTGLPVMPAPATVAVRVLLPGTRPRVQESAVARPLASVVCEAPVTRPPPAVTAKTTTAPTDGCWLASRTRTEGAAATACPTSAVWVVAVTASIEAGPGRVAVAVKVTGLPVIPLPAMEAVTTLEPGVEPSVHEVALASPFASVVWFAPARVPLPCVTAKVTSIPGTGSLFWSRTIMAGGTATAVFTMEDWLVGEAAATVAGVGPGDTLSSGEPQPARIVPVMISQWPNRLDRFASRIRFICPPPISDNPCAIESVRNRQRLKTRNEMPPEA